MDEDLSQSDMSRFTTMLTAAGIEFARLYGAGGLRGIQAGNLVLWFGQLGTIAYGSVAKKEAP